MRSATDNTPSRGAARTPPGNSLRRGPVSGRHTVRRARRRLSTAACVVMLLTACGAPADRASAAPSAGQISDVLRQGLAFVQSKQNESGAYTSRFSRDHDGAVEALVVLTAVAAGEEASRKPLAKTVDYMRRAAAESILSRSLRIMAWARLSKASPSA